MQEQLPSTAPEGGGAYAGRARPPAAEVPAYTETLPRAVRHSLRGTVDVDNAVYLTFDDGPSARRMKFWRSCKAWRQGTTFFVVVGANEEGDLERIRRSSRRATRLLSTAIRTTTRKFYASVEAYLEDFNQMFCQIYTRPPASSRRSSASPAAASTAIMSASISSSSPK